MPKSASRGLLALLCAGFACTQAAEITVRAARNGDVLQVEAAAEFEGSIAGTWQVLTDYDQLARFIPDLETSRVVSRERNEIVVEQKGDARLLFFSYPIDVRLLVTEFPREKVVSRAIAGNFREMQGVYTLEERDGRVKLRYSGRLAPDFYVPPLIGTWVLRRNVAVTFGAMVNEIERRHREALPPNVNSER